MKIKLILVFLCLVILFYFIKINKEGFQNNKPKKIYWGIVHIPSYKKRAENVKNTISKYPFIKIYPAYYQIDKCCKYLAKQNIKISPNYWKKSKKIHIGKVGNSTTIISFLNHLKDNNYNYGVWIEDDIILSQRNINEINELINKDFKKPILRLLGIGFEVIIIKVDLIHKLLQPLKKDDIFNPIDAVWNELQLIEQHNLKIKRMDETLSSENSTILTTQLLDIKEVNDMIENYKKL